MDLRFSTSVLLMIFMLCLAFYSAGEKRGPLDYVARGIVREHNSPRSLLCIAFLSMVGFLLTLALLGVLVFQGDIYDAEHPWKSIGLAVLDVSVAFVAGGFIRVWDHAVQKREWYSFIKRSSSSQERFWSVFTYSPKLLIWDTARLLLGGAITGVFPGVVVSQPSREIANRVSQVIEDNFLLLFVVSIFSVIVSFCVGVVGGLIVIAHGTQAHDHWEYIYLWFAWAGVSSISLFAFDLSRSTFRKWRDRLSDDIGKNFGR